MPCLWIERYDVAIEGFIIPINTCLLPRQYPQHNEGYRRNAQCALLPQAWQVTDAISGHSDNDGHNPDASKVLIAISDESKLHIAVINKS